MTQLPAVEFVAQPKPTNLMDGFHMPMVEFVHPEPVYVQLVGRVQRKPKRMTVRQMVQMFDEMGRVEK